MNDFIRILLILACIVALFYLVVALARSQREEEIGSRRAPAHPEPAAVSGWWKSRTPARADGEAA